MEAHGCACHTSHQHIGALIQHHQDGLANLLSPLCSCESLAHHKCHQPRLCIPYPSSFCPAGFQIICQKLSTNPAHCHHSVSEHQVLFGSLCVYAHKSGKVGDRYLDEHRITPKQLQLLHGFHIECNDRVVIVHSFIHNQTIRSFLPLQDRSRKISLCCCWLPVTPRKTIESKTASQALARQQSLVGQQHTNTN